MILKNVEKKDNKIAITVATDAKEFETALNAAYLKNKKYINIPGFRKGKAPRMIIEGMYGSEVFYQDAMDDLAPQAFEFAIKESEAKYVGAPSITDVNVTEEKTVEYTFEVEAYPEVELGEYKGIKAERPSTPVSDEELNGEIESVRKQNARKISVERAAELGDNANIDFDGYLDGERFDGGKAEGYALVLGSNTFVPGFEEQIVGMNVGEEKDINITFPEDYVENLAGKDVVFKVKLNSLTVDELPELDDEFAKDVSEFDTLDEYKADLKEKLQKRHDEQSDNAFHVEVMKQAVENMKVNVPDVMVNDKLEEMLRNYAQNFGLDDSKLSFQQLCEQMGINEETLSSLRPSALEQVKNDILLDAVVAKEQLEVSAEEFENYLKEMADRLGAPAETVKNYFGEAYLKANQLKEKAANLIYDSAEVLKKAAKAKRKSTKKAEAEPEENNEEKAE